jgi:Hypervirulence associated proteins TUDOR domain
LEDLSLPAIVDAQAGIRSHMSDNEFKKGDKVTWQSHGSTAEGTVQEKITSDTQAAGRTVRASKDDPQYRVRSEKSGNDAVHKPGALKKKSG